MVSKRDIKIAFTGGATGGHIYPNLAVAAALRDLYPQSKFYYLAHPDKLEARLLSNPELKDDKDFSYSQYIEFIPIKGQALPSLRHLGQFLAWFWGFWQESKRAKQALLTHEIDLVFGTGGYIAGPVFAAALLLARPYILHNLDAHLGLANRVFLRGARFLSLAFVLKEFQQRDSHKVRLIANPVSSKFFCSDKSFNPRHIKILITGGSQGAASINQAVGHALARLSNLAKDSCRISIKHITGEANYEQYLHDYLGGDVSKYQTEYFDYEPIAYSHSMPELCHWADLALCRSGAMTIAEMAAARVVPVFLPLASAANDHQYKNAAILLEAGAAYVFRLEAEALDALEFLVHQPDRILEMRNKLGAFANPDAAKQLAKLILEALDLD